METKEWPTKVTPKTENKSLVLIYSCGAEIGNDALPTDYLGDYVRDVFKLVGFSDFHQIRMTGVMSDSRKERIQEAQENVQSIVGSLNKKFS